MKLPIERHENNLKNIISFLEREKNHLLIQVKKVTELEKEIETLRRQIARAKKENKTAFDSEKYQLYKD